MELLRVPNTYEDLKVSATLTGITILKENKFKSRISGSKEIIHHPSLGIILKKNDWMERERLSTIKKRKVNPKINLIKCEGSTKKIKSYSINKKEIIHKIRGYLNQQLGEKQLYFWTITFPLKTNDDTAFLLFNKWLTRLRFEKMLKNYLWVSERQENGTIHFHMAIPHRMDIKKSNRYMRACIMTCIDQKLIKFTREDAKNYNGVDISKDRKTKKVTNFAKRKKEKSLSNYLTKYITKNNGSFTHLAWHSSRGYSNIIISVRYLQKEVEKMGLMLMVSTEKMFENEWCKFYRWINKPPKEITNYLSFINQIAQSKLN